MGAGGDGRQRALMSGRPAEARRGGPLRGVLTIVAFGLAVECGHLGSEAVAGADSRDDVGEALELLGRGLDLHGRARR